MQRRPLPSVRRRRSQRRRQRPCRPLLGGRPRAGPALRHVLGDERYDDRWPDSAPSVERPTRRRIGPCSRRHADPGRRARAEQVITRDLLLPVAENHLEALDAEAVPAGGRPHVRHRRSGPVTGGPVPAGRRLPSRLEKLLARLRGVPGDDRAVLSNAREGVADGRTAAAMPVRRAIEQIERLLAMPAADAHRQPPWSRSPTTRPRADRRAVEEHVYAGAARACATTLPTSTSRTPVSSPACQRNARRRRGLSARHPHA